jgi:glycolate oxidase
MVLINGEVVRLGGKHLDAEGYDLLGVIMTGSEGLLGVVTEVTVRILQKPETARAVLIGFDQRTGRRRQCVADIIAAGIIPGGMEMMDRPAIHAAEEFVPCRLSARRRSAADRRTRRAGKSRWTS